MKKFNYKLISIILTVALLLSVTATAFAADEQETVDVVAEQQMDAVPSAITMPAPTGLATASEGETSLKLTWNKIEPTSEYTPIGYFIYRSSSRDSGYEKLGDYTSEASYTDTGLVTGQKYYYKVSGFYMDAENRIEGLQTSAISCIPGQAAVFAPPENLMASSAGVDEIKLGWDDVGLALGYNIYRSEYKTYGYSLIKELAGRGNTSFTDSGLVMGKTYYYTVAAYKGEGAEKTESSQSGPVWASAGSSELGVPQNFKVESGLSKTIKLSWGKATAAEGYNLYRSEYKTYGYSFIKELEGAASLNYVDSGLVEGKTYYYKVAAYRGAIAERTQGAYTEPAFAVVQNMLLDIPAGMKLDAASNSLTISWNAVKEAGGYEVQRATAADGVYTVVKTILSPATTSFTDSGLTEGQTYFYKVRAFAVVVGNTVWSEFGAAVSGEILGTALAAPQGFTASSYAYNKIQLGWSAVNGATGYLLFGADVIDGEYTLLAILESGKTLSWIHANVPTGIAKYYKIQAFKIVNSVKIVGDPSAIITGKALVAKPGSFTAKGIDKNSIGLSWSKPVGAGGYYIYRATSANGTYSRITTLLSGTAASYTDKNCPKPGTKYYYKIKAYYISGDTRISGVTAGPVAGQTKTDGVTGVRAACSAYNKITISWSAKTGAKGYQVYYATSVNGNYVRVGSTGGTNYTMTTSPEKKYYIKVRHYTKIGSKVTYGTFSSPIAASSYYAAPDFYVSMSGNERSFDTAFGVTVRNASKKTLAVYETQARLIDPRNASNNCSLTLYDGDNHVAKKLIAAGQSAFLLFENRNGFPYHKDTTVQFRFYFDGRWYQCNASSQKASYIKI